MHKPRTRSSSRTNIAAQQVLQAARYMRTPDAGLLGQSVRFLLTGGVVAVFYLTITIVLADGLGMPFQIALVIGFVTGLVVHFLLQRHFVWVRYDEFAISVRDQIGRYLFVAAIQYGTTVAVTSFVPSALHVRTTFVYIVWILCISVSNFLIFGRGIFHSKREGITKLLKERDD